ncbi:hypothetical protein [Hydrocarboniphaga sp.]|uniref:hypothetical protein n=1 Tax=Hydrocarboniphaga sp. TaxID=2033016 RepID=UPI003D11E4DA
MLKSTYLGLLFAFSLLAGCGGGGPSFVDNDDDSGSGGGSTTTVSRVILLASTTQLPSAADQPAEGVTLSAQALDASGNLISASTIGFSIPPGSGALIVAADDGSGTRTAALTTAGDPTPRSITVTASASGISSTLDIQVTGTALTLTGPDTIGFGQTGEYSAKLVDSAGNGIGGSTVEFATTAGSITPNTAITATGTGVAKASLTGSASGEVSVQALGLTASHAVAISADQLTIEAPASSATIALNTAQSVAVQWLRNGSAAETAGATVDLSASRGTLASSTLTLDGTGRASTTISSTNAGGAVIVASSQQLGKPSASVPLEFVATTAATINVQASPATLPVSTTSVVTAIVRDPTGNLVKGKQVDFKLTDISGGTLSAPNATTDSQGKASVTYAASNVSSADKGVRVDATVHDTTSVTGFASFTVGGQALRITLGTGNEIQEPNSTTYDQPYSVIVTDSSGNPVTGATFRLSVLPTRYRKGYRQTVDTDDDGTPDAWGYVVTATCGNEDVDYDGVKDTGEDFNNNGILDPGNVASTPTTVALDANGAGEFLVRYPQDRADWGEVELRGVASVAGTETTARAVFWLNISADDVSDLKVSPPGAISPYGVGTSCSDPN